jgi:hypothetical protein
MGNKSGARSSTCSSSVPDISVETYNSGMFALTNMVIGSPSLIGRSIYCNYYPPYTAFTVNIFYRL